VKSLEQIARKMFIEFSRRRTGLALDWRYISKERKLSWMKEVVEIFDMCLNDLDKELELPHIGLTGAASFEKGFVAGQKFENNRIRQRVEYLKTWLDEQYREYEHIGGSSTEQT